MSGDETPETLVESAAGEAPKGAIARGTVVDRYVVLRELGAGGFGVVYEARDPDLDRRVALKVFRRSASALASERFRREGKAIAQLDHPNVVKVFDVGEVDGRWFIAMELVDGVSLAQWLRTPRRRREVLEVFGQVGRGLAAAHARGLVHRDVKPDNVLLGDDGRVRVADFGLARAADDTEPDGGEDAASGLARVTSTGAVLGTPAYMAPEQFRGHAADAATDQFAYCVALCEALTGARPFPGDDTDTLRTKVLAGERRAYPRELPAWLRRVLDRGLAPRATDRFASMDALLAELEKDRWRVARWAGALGLAGAAAVLAVAAARDRAPQVSPCSGAGDTLVGVWDGDVRGGLDRAFQADPRPFAAATFTAVADELDRRAEAWTAMRVQSCEATRRGLQTPHVQDLRARCLDDRLAELGAAIRVLGAPAGDELLRAIDVVYRLPAVARCADVGTLEDRAPLPDDPAARVALTALTGQVAEAESLLDAARYQDGVTAIDGVADRAAALGYPPLEARARAVAGRLQWELGDAEAGARLLYDAARAAATSHDDRLSAEIWLVLAGKIAIDRQDEERGAVLVEAAEVAVARAPDDLLQARLLRLRGAGLRLDGEYDDARAAWEDSLATFQRAYHRDAPEIAAMLTNLGIVARAQGAYDEARAFHERSVAMHEALVGPDHPNVSFPLLNLGVLLLDQGKLDEARGYLERCLRIREAAYGPDHLNVAFVLQNLAVVLRGQDDLAGARQAAERALAIAAELPAQHSLRAFLHQELGVILRDQDDLEGSRAHHLEALAIWEDQLGPDGAEVATALEGLGQVELARDRPAAAAPYLERALAIRRAVGEPDLLAETAFSLARALPASARTRARSLAREARAGWAASAADDARSRVTEIDAWLARR